MKGKVIVDSGPLVAFLDHRDRFHEWVMGEVASIEPPLLTCEAVMAEVWYLLRKFPKAQEALLSLVSRNVLAIAFDLSAEVGTARQLTSRYRNVPMALADACLVRMAELYAGSSVLTLDGDFTVYRRHGRQVIPLIAPRRG